MQLTQVDEAACRCAFECSGGIICDGVLPHADANSLVQAVSEIEKHADEAPMSVWPWMIRYCEGDGVHLINGRGRHWDLAAYRRVVRAYASDPEGYRSIYYWYAYMNLCDASVEQAVSQPEALSRFGTMLRDEHTRAQLERMTGAGLSGNRPPYAALTKFAPGCFLGPHDDFAPSGTIYQLAFVYFLNPVWRSDWGGLLEFRNSDGSWSCIEPIFNRLVLFVPTRESTHRVTAVKLTAPSARYAISGWYLA